MNAHELKRHAKCAYHTKASSGVMIDACSPTRDDFLKVLRGVSQHGYIAGSGLSEVGSSKKIRKMIICLAEAIFQADRAFVLAAKSITILRDVRKGTVAIRFVAVDKALRVHSGLLGCANHMARFGSGSSGLLQSTNHLFTKFASNSDPPHALNLKVRQRLRAYTHIVAVDAASDEVVASELMRQPINEVINALTPNLKMVLRDKAHASRRTDGIEPEAKWP